MYNTSIQRRLFGETLEILRAALHGEPVTSEGAPPGLSPAPPRDAATAAQGVEAVVARASADASSAPDTPVPAARAAAAFFRSAAWDAARTGNASADGAPAGGAGAASGASGTGPESGRVVDAGSVEAADRTDGRRNVRAVLTTAAWDGAPSPARVIALDRESAREAPAGRDTDAEALQRAATESALAAARGGRRS